MKYNYLQEKKWRADECRESSSHGKSGHEYQGSDEVMQMQYVTRFSMRITTELR
jgi:hypothetical protein